VNQGPGGRGEGGHDEKTKRRKFRGIVPLNANAYFDFIQERGRNTCGS
jgi:hypothetical protein